MPLEQTVAAVAYPVTLAEAKAHLRVGFSTDDDLITDLIGEAVGYVERELRLQMMPATWKQRFERWELQQTIWADPPPMVREVLHIPAATPNTFGLARLPLGLRPVSSVTSLKYYSADDTLTTVSSDDYYTLLSANPPAITSGRNGWPWDISAYHPAPVEVVFVAGWASAAAVPLPLKRAVRLLVAMGYELRSVTEPGQYFREIPYGVRNILDLWASGAMQ